MDYDLLDDLRWEYSRPEYQEDESMLALDPTEREIELLWRQ